MKCKQFHLVMDDLIDHELSPDMAAEAQQHLDQCQACHGLFRQARELQNELRKIPGETADPAFVTRAIGKAAGASSPSSKRWYSFGGAMAAGLALIVSVGVFSPGSGSGQAEYPAVAISLDRVQQVSFSIAAEQAMDQVQFTVQLPAGVEMAGMPGQQIVEWQGKLRPGANMLSLPLVAKRPSSGVLEARVSFGDRSKAYKVLVQADRLHI